MTPDDRLDLILAAHRDMTEEESRRLDAALVLLLADRIEPARLADLLDVARAAVKDGTAFR